VRILHINKFFHFTGGGDRYFFDVADIMKQKGHENIFFSTHDSNNCKTPYEKYFVKGFSEKNINSFGFWEKVRVFFNGIYSFEAKKNIRKLIKDTRPDIAHVYNIFYQISPSIFHTLKKEGVPIVMSLLDSHIICASATLYNQGHNCDKCSRSYVNILTNKCYKNSFLPSLMAFFAKVIHKSLKLWDEVDLFMTASQNFKNLLINWGFDKDKIMINPYYAKTEEVPPLYNFKDYFLFVGRLTFEKGVDVLLEAMKNISGIKLKIMGDGNARNWMENYVKKHNIKNVEFIGTIENKSEFYEYIRNAMFVVVPSTWFDFPLIVLNSFCAGKPVIGSNSGGIPEMIDHRKNGLIFHRGRSKELEDAIKYLLRNKDLVIKYGKNARQKAEKIYTVERHYSRIMQVYNTVLKKTGRKKSTNLLK